MAILKEVLETSSSSSSTSTTNVYKYDIFLSFRGTDTRYNFTDHLYNALVSANLTTFLDDEKIPTGEELKPELESAIKASRAFIIVLSKNYASSRWCLDELVLILQQNKTIFPIFYHIEPADLRKQQSTFGDAMAMHKQRMEEETDAEKRSQLAHKMELWKKALTQVADLKGRDAEGRKETEFIKEIVSDVYHRLGVPLRTSQPQLIGAGADYNIRLITSWLKDGSSYTADILTILGIGGIGKTSLARYIYGIHCRDEFDSSSFIEDISRKCLLDSQKELFDGISHISSIPAHNVHNVFAYTSMIENTLACKKVFVVLDDVDSLNQLDALLGNRGFHPGSKIIVTTKDGSLTERCALFNPQVQHKHIQVLLKGLYETEALELLCIHAFKCQTPKKGYEKVLDELIRYCGGHPLALEILGKSLRNRDVAYWEGYIKGLKKGPNSRIQNVLQMSFESLPTENDKELFKHIACFFVGADKDVTEIILEACDIDTRSGITNLMDRCLLSNIWINKLMMHQLVQEMGRDLVRQESPHKPWERSRLCYHEESFMVLKQKKEKENLLGLALDMRVLDKEKLRGSFELKPNSLYEMDRLMLLQLNYVQIDGFFEKFPEELRWLCMHGFPLKSFVIPSDSSLENVVVLDMSYSKIESFGIPYCNPQPPTMRRKLLGSVKILDLRFCNQLHSLSGFLELPALEKLIVKNCTSLFDVCESIEQCVELVHVDMSYCYKLKNLPILKTVKTLLLDNCNIPSLFNQFTISSPCSLVTLSLKGNNLSNESFPNDLSSLSMLKVLRLDGNPLVSMPNCVRSLARLEELTMYGCVTLTSIEYPPRTLRKLTFGFGIESVGFNNTSLLRKIVFDPEMSPLNLSQCIRYNIPFSSMEYDGIVKIQPIRDVREKELHSLGWPNLEFLKKRRVGNGQVVSQTQMYYEFGIFSTIYVGTEMPDWITHRNKGSSISFTIPSSPKELRGLNFCCVVTAQRSRVTFSFSHKLPPIIIRNITKSHTWIYEHYMDRRVSVGEKCLTYLSHWMFGMNEMESGDHVAITVMQLEEHTFGDFIQETSECGVSVVYDDGEMEEEDVLGYYKSWNHIIGGDLSPFQRLSGEYHLNNNRIMGRQILGRPIYYHLFGNGSTYKFKAFKAISQRKSHILNPAASQNGIIKGSSLQIEEAQEEVRNEAEAEKPKDLHQSFPDRDPHERYKLFVALTGYLDMFKDMYNSAHKLKQVESFSSEDSASEMFLHWRQRQKRRRMI